MLKIKVAYGIDMRLWRYELAKGQTVPMFEHLQNFICESFEFKDPSQFRVILGEEKTETVVSNTKGFEAAYFKALQLAKKSLKLRVFAVDANAPKVNDEPLDSKENDANEQPSQEAEAEEGKPKEDLTKQLNKFLSDNLNVDLLSALFVATLEAMSASDFQVGFMDAMKNVLAEADEKYLPLTSNPVWPHFVGELLPKYSYKLESFVVPLMRMNGAVNVEMIKQCVPRIMSMMKYHCQQSDCADGIWCGSRRRGRGRRGRGRGGCRGRSFSFGGCRGSQGFSWGPPQFGGFDGHSFGGFDPQWQQRQCNENEEEMTQEFQFTDELASIMNMGFEDMDRIKGLLRKHNGDTQKVINTLVAAK